MTASDEGEIAAALARALLDGTTCELPLDRVPDREAAYRVQELAIAKTGLRRAGYKVGATSVAAQVFLGAPGPIHGPVFAERLLENGSELAIPDGLLGVECEFGFRFGRDFPRPGEVVSETSLRAAVAQCVPALEIAGRRLGAAAPIDEVGTTADFCYAVAVVRGGALPGWAALDLAQIPITVRVEGEVVAQGSGEAVQGGPLGPLLWLAALLAGQGRTIHAGEIVVTGSCTGISPVRPGQVVEATYGEHGLVQARFARPLPAA